MLAHARARVRAHSRRCETKVSYHSAETLLPLVAAEQPPLRAGRQPGLSALLFQRPLLLDGPHELAVLLALVENQAFPPLQALDFPLQL
jgi:hypothetical protein